ncbi:Ferroporti-1 [Lipomyces orientalis]|uniref:Ferroporti-1 n=1 Tax=Lipomyces orientalis TaxID=1233043 RepID=A0ACC3TSX1_9ASCO
MALRNDILMRVCVSHFLSAWNSRIFEYSAVLFLASIFPGTLLPPSVYALWRALSAMFLAPAMGRQVDRTNRLVVVRRSIVFQRAAVACSCALFVAMILLSVGAASTSILIKAGFIAILSAFACVEKLASIMNTVSVERDWVVVIAGSSSEDLQRLNSIMRRIDLFCKMAGPLAISFLIGFTVLGSVWALLFLNVASVFIEYFTIARVYKIVPALATRNGAVERDESSDVQEVGLLASDNDDGTTSPASTSPLSTYIYHELFLPSFALSFLYFTVLNFGGQFVTYLLAVGYSPSAIGVLRTVSVLFELSATWAAPIVMKQIGAVRGGMWFINWQAICCIAAAVAIYHSGSPSADDAPVQSTDKFLFVFASKATAAAIFAVVCSRVGLWGFDLCAQILIQEGVEAESRTSFSSVESSFQNFFELLSFASTIIFDKPAVFAVPALLSTNSVVIAAILFAIYARRVRKHLLHLPSMRGWFGFKTTTVAQNTVIQQELNDEV